MPPKAKPSFTCYYCNHSTLDFGAIIDHNVIKHPDCVLKYRYKTLSAKHNYVTQTKNFGVIPYILKQDGKYVIPDKNCCTIHVESLLNKPTVTASETESPVKKKQRYDEPQECSVEEICLADETPMASDQATASSFDCNQSFNTEDDLLQKLTNMLPDIIKNLKLAGHLDVYMKFSELVASDRFPLDNIAFLLFEDVVNWYYLENTSQMRYNDVVRLFWRTGLKLFKGKFLRFMSGLKNSGNIINDVSDRGIYNPEKSEINFAVPARNILDQVTSPVSEEKLNPGILSVMLETLSDKDPDQINTYKLCVDGKKINASVEGKLGQIDLWNHEDKPTNKEKCDRFDVEIEHVDALSALIRSLQTSNIIDVASCLSDIKEDIRQQSIFLIYIISKRLHELRQLKVSKQLAHEKFMKLVSGDWRDSKFSYVLSSLKTSMYDISSCIEDSLKCIDNIGSVVAECNNAHELYATGKLLNLEKQRNYVCIVDNLQPTNKQNIQQGRTDNVKQRSTAWHAIRKSAHVTGSTFYSAIGMDTLKKQQDHYKIVFNDKIPSEPSDEIKLRMQYGTENEINCVATLVGKILPIFDAESSYIEEGCYVINNTNTKLVVSPDGSCRNQSEELSNQIVRALEIKCPFPGKLFTTPIQYSIPQYYVTQIMCEMAALKTNSLWFLSYSEESTSLLEAVFDEKLWTLMLETMEDLYGDNHKFPTRLHPNVTQIRQLIRDFVKHNVKFIAEVPSLQAIECKHDKYSLSVSGRCSHIGVNTIPPSCQIECVEEIIDKSKNVIQTAFHLQKQKASEVLMFLLSDLDRMSKKELGHAVPVAYGFKGYSMKTDTMRKMLDAVLNECYRKGLYVPVISFDGQWFNIAVRSNDGYPMTLLQLQKDVFTKAKKESKPGILKKIFSLNSLPPTDTLEEVQEKVEVSFRQNTEGQIVSPIKVGTLFDSEPPIVSSAHISRLLKSVGILKTTDSNLHALVTASSHCHDTQYVSMDGPDDHAASTDESVLAEITNETFHSVDQYDQPNSLPDEGISRQTAANEKVDEISDTEASNLQVVLDQEIVTLTKSDAESMLCLLQNDTKTKASVTMIPQEFLMKFIDQKTLSSYFNKNEVKMCLKSLVEKLKENNINYSLSWPKYKIVDLLCRLKVGFPRPSCRPVSRGNRTKNVSSLRKLCQTTIRKFSKDVLNAIYAEYIFPKELHKWRSDLPFQGHSLIEGVDDIMYWYSKPEFREECMCYHFFLLDCHHLLTNARIKCCKTGILEAGVNRQAWVKVAKNSDTNNSNLSIALVEDLLDKQSNAFALRTFCKEVEDAMLQNGDIQEAEFCHLIREWYESEDNPGLDVFERIRRRLAFRKWLLTDVNFNSFPPPGAYVKGIPIVLFEGILTNIDRRLQLFPFVKKGVYNVRALGSLEAENIFGEFQDLDPKGSGVMRPDDIPSAISTACELLYHRLHPDRGFYMHTSKAKVYPTYKLMLNSDALQGNAFLYPTITNSIIPRNHAFDVHERAKRKPGSVKRGTISQPTMPAKGMKPVREHHRLNESKILPHVRRGIEF